MQMRRFLPLIRRWWPIGGYVLVFGGLIVTFVVDALAVVRVGVR